MAENKNLLLKITLVLFTVMTLGYGIIYYLFPDLQIQMAGGEPIPSGWIRWSGGVLIALGIGSILVLRKPAKQGIFVAMASIGTLLVGLANFYELAFQWDASYNLMPTLIPAIVLTLIAILFWISLRQSKEILW